MKVLVSALAATLVLSAPLAALASHGGGGHGSGGFQGGGHGVGGFQGGARSFGGGGRGFGGFHGAGGRGFGHDHDHGFHHDRRDVIVFDDAFGFGWGFYDDPWAFGYAGFYPYDDVVAYDPAVLTTPTGAVAPATETSQCGAWRWESDIQKYRWVTEAC